MIQPKTSDLVTLLPGTVGRRPLMKIHEDIMNTFEALDENEIMESSQEASEVEPTETVHAMSELFPEKPNDLKAAVTASVASAEEDDSSLDDIENILELDEDKYPRFTLAKNKARFLRLVSSYRQKEEWIQVAPLSGVTKLFKNQTKELESIRSNKLDYEMELETGTLTPSQRSYKRDELKMCKVHEKMAVHLMYKLHLKIKSGRREGFF